MYGIYIKCCQLELKATSHNSENFFSQLTNKEQIHNLEFSDLHHIREKKRFYYGAQFRPSVAGIGTTHVDNAVWMRIDAWQNPE